MHPLSLRKGFMRIAQALNKTSLWCMNTEFVWNYSVVEYATYDDMKAAMRKLDGADLNGRRLRLTEDYRGSKRRRLVSIRLG